MEVVVVLPWLPATAMPYFRRISSASSSPRGITGICRRRASCTSGFCSSTAELTTSARAPATLDGGVAFVDRAPPAPASRSVVARELQVRAADLVAQVQQHLGDAAHADAADPGEVKVLWTKKHFLIVLFRLAPQLSIEKVGHALACPFSSGPAQPNTHYHRATSSRISAARCAAPGRANWRAASPIRSSAPCVCGQLRVPARTGVLRSSARRAPGAPLRRARWLPRCASGGRRRRTGTAPEWTACPPRPAPKPRPRRTGTPPGRPRANAAGISAMNGVTSPSRPESANACAQSLPTSFSAALVHDAHRKPRRAKQRPAFPRRPG